MERIGPDFFERSPLAAARDLIGMEFEWDGKRARIVETEAYLDVGDEACHTWSRPTARAFVAHHAAGTAYVYLNYGVHWLFNVLAKSPQGSGFVLFRALEPATGSPGAVAAGPGKLTRFLGIDGADHGGAFLSREGRGIYRGSAAAEVIAGPRIGISRATDLPWRFGEAGSRSLSRRF